MGVELEGKKIKEFRYLSQGELKAEGWDENEKVVAIILENNVKLYASRDSEGNGPGALFGQKYYKPFVINVKK